MRRSDADAYGYSNRNFHTDCNSDANGNIYSNSNAYADSNAYANSNIYPDSNGDVYANGNGESDSDINAHGYDDAQTDAYATAGTDATAATHPATTPVSCKISWINSGTRERKRANSCLWIQRTLLLASVARTDEGNFGTSIG
jgi:hypothetical protein